MCVPLLTNIGIIQVVACGVVGGMDLAALLPKYLTIRRGSFVIAIIGICINPWRILNVSIRFPRLRPHD